MTTRSTMQTIPVLWLLLGLTGAGPAGLIFAQDATHAGDHPTFHVDVTGHGKPMILIPGLASSGATWDSTVARYSGHYECHVLTLAGFAGQPPVADFSLDRVISDLSTYISSKRITRPVIIGHSLGGSIALRLAIEHPDQAGSFIIVDALPALGAIQNPAITPEQEKEIADKIQAGMSAIPAEQREQMARSSIQTMATNPADVDRIVGWSQRTDWHTEVTAMSQLMGTDLREQVSAIRSPLLVLGTWVAYAAYGGEPAVKQTFEKQYAKAKGVQIQMAPKARHFIMFDDPAWFFAQTDAFLNKFAAQ